MTDGKFVTWDRWDATNEAVVQRIEVLERHSEELRGAESEHRSIEDRLGALEQAGKASAAGEAGRKERTWALVLILIGSLVMPILTTAVITFLHLKSYH